MRNLARVAAIGVSIAAPARAQSAASPTPTEVVVRGESSSERLHKSARAVHVIETSEAKKQSSDLGEVLAREPGISLRREGGLGSSTRLSLNGLGDEQVRVFLDGVPLGLAGYSFGIANVPVNLLERVEVYRGVVPIRFGADALGGAVNLVSDERVSGTHASASYQTGSFGTQRYTLGVRTHDEPGGFFSRLHAFHDVADNAYPIDVEWPNALGKLERRSAYRFHDGYRASGANLEAGLVKRPWAKRLSLRAFLTDHEKELQHGITATIPYGDIESRRTTAGWSARYVQGFWSRSNLDALVGFTLSRTQFRDPDRCLYDWWGRCIREQALSEPSDYLTRSHTTFARVHLDWLVEPGQQTLRLSVAPTRSVVVGDERAGADPNDGDQRELLSAVSGLEHELSLFDRRLVNIAFAKAYVHGVRANKHVGEIVLNRDRTRLSPGIGDSLRYAFAPWLYAKASYEFATRLPTLEEIFGDGVLVLPNLDLEPERSHNLNLGVNSELTESAWGRGTFELNTFLRDTHKQILMLPSQETSVHQNVYSARALGVELIGRYTSPSELLVLGANLTSLDFRNTSSEGNFAAFSGDRIPNRPYFFVNASARINLRDVAHAGDQLSFTWFMRYVERFFLSWESAGARDQKAYTPAQFVHSAVLVYDVPSGPATISNSFEIQNLTDQRAYDYFGVQRPGRAFYYKLSAQL
ncbi:MAG: TonB-dependent receptor [Polyangiaceae bacterium]